VNDARVPDGEAERPHFTIVINWFEELKEHIRGR
jgi:hypothetical protein